MNDSRHHSETHQPVPRTYQVVPGIHLPLLSDRLRLHVVIPAQAGIQIAALDSRLRGNDVRTTTSRCHTALLLLACGVLISGCSSEPSEKSPSVSSVDASEPGDNSLPASAETSSTGIPSRLHTENGFSTGEKTSTDLSGPKPLRFSDVAEELGLSATYQNGANGRLLMVESIGGGGAWLDFDRDGHLDACVVQGGLPDEASPVNRPLDVLFRQRHNRFESVEEIAGLRDRQYSQGIAVADFDNDGFEDLYITNVGTNVFYRNQGDGTFVEMNSVFPVIEPRWSSSAAWGDLDQDGLLDLYVCNYLKYDPYDPLECLKDGLPALCHPRQIADWPDECFRNRGDGTFERVTDLWGLRGSGNKALGVAILDFTGDYRPDIFVANDTTANFLFVRQPDGTFSDEALGRGCALSGSGDAQASMGVAIADYDSNGYPDILLSHFTGESNTLYRNLGDSGMQDVSAITGMRKLSFPKLGFGIVMHDFNSDGYVDCLVANGHIDERHADYDGYEQLPQLLTFDGRNWLDQSGAGPYFSRRLVGRGIALGDFDADGDFDALVIHQNQPVSLLQNNERCGNSVRLRFSGISSNRQGIGCVVTVRCHDTVRVAELPGGTSFASSHQPVLIVPTGNENGPCEITVRWPSGIQQHHTCESTTASFYLREPVSASDAGFWITDDATY